MSFPRYPTYKDSGVEWLGEVPEHWEVWKLSHAFTLIGSGTTPKTDNRDYYDGGEIPWVNTGDLNDRELDECKKRITALAITEHSALTIYPAGSLLIAMYGATIGKLALLNFAATVNQACCVFTGKSEIASKFMFYWFLGLRQQIISLATGGGQPNISQDILRSLQVAIPPLSQQRQIATFLDHETAKIDALIAEQQRLIELLQEKRQAVISHAVTKGLNPDAPMKDSGVEWLGEVPEHWEVVPIGMICSRITYGFTNPMPTCESGPYMLTANDVGMGAINYENCRRTSVDAFKTELSDKSRPEAGDILLTKDGTLGRVALFDEGGGEAACINQSVVSIRLLPDKMVPGFAVVALQSSCYQEKMLFDAGGTTIKHIYVSRLSKMPIAFPGQDEQKTILLMIGAKIDEWLILIEQSRKFLALLQERRSALISAAVTGQIDVRGLVAEAVAA